MSRVVHILPSSFRLGLSYKSASHLWARSRGYTYFASYVKAGKRYECFLKSAIFCHGYQTSAPLLKGEHPFTATHMRKPQR